MGSRLSKEKLIALHGFLGRPTDFDFLKQESILNRYEVVVPDYFKTSELSPSVDFQTWGQNFWKHYNFQNCSIVAYSLGGRLAQQALAAAPERVKHLILISAGLGTAAEKNLSLINWSEKFLTEPWDSLMNQWNSQKVFLNSQEPVRIESNYDRSGLSLSFKNWGQDAMPSSEGLLSKYSEKIVGLCGQADEKYKRIYTEAFHKKLFSNLVVAENSGHRVIFDEPYRVIDSIHSL